VDVLSSPSLPEPDVKGMGGAGDRPIRGLDVSEYERAIFAAAAFAQKATDCLHGMQSPPSDV
jgi:hypothetical protein